MRKIRTILLVCISLSLLLGVLFFFLKDIKPKPAGIKVNSNPTSSVYVNGVFVGKTPYIGTNPATQINLKLVPDNGPIPLFPYQTKLNLVSGIQTVVERNFGPTEEDSSGDVVSFDDAGGTSAGVIIISTPDNSQVYIDGASLGFTPYNFSTITTGKHKIVIKNEGYQDRTLNIKTVKGLRLTVFVKLARGSLATPSPSPSPSPQSGPKMFVVIGNTSTGFLRMRTEPDTKGEEIAELKPGEKYLYLDRDTASGWFKIQYQDPAPGLPSGITGWVSNQYSKVVDEAGNPTTPPTNPSPTSTPAAE